MIGAGGIVMVEVVDCANASGTIATRARVAASMAKAVGFQGL